MFSEWFVDIPGDLDENWLMMLCPKGRRTLVITQRVGIHVALLRVVFFFVLVHQT